MERGSELEAAEGRVSWPSSLPRSAPPADEAYTRGEAPHLPTRDNSTDRAGVEQDPLTR